MKKRMKKRILSCILTLAMVISLVPVTTKPAFAAVGAISVENSSGQRIYADGNAIIIQAGSNPDFTNVIIDTNSNGIVDGLEAPIDLNAAGLFSASPLTGNTAEGFDLSLVRIFGGSKRAPITGGTKITMLSGKIYFVYGGGYSYWDSASVTGNTNIDIMGGSVEFICGGGEGTTANIIGNTNINLYGGDICAVRAGGIDSSVSGSTNVVVEGATVGEDSGFIYGGGLNSGATVNSSHIIVNPGSTISGWIYGGGQSGATVLTSTNITINGGNFHSYSIYGGGVDSDVGTNGTSAESYITINGGTFDNNGTSNIFGGGYTQTSVDAKVYGDTHVIINNATFNGDSVYGGGYAPRGNADVTGDTSIVINAGNVSSLNGSGLSQYGASATVGGAASITVSAGTVGHIYLGGSNNTARVGSASTTITGGTISNLYKGFVTGSALLTYTGGTITGTVDASISKPVSFIGLTAVDGVSGSSSTTQLTLTFDEDPFTLTAGKITVTGATKGTLSGTGTTRTLNISNITVANGQNVTVTVATPAAFTITPASKTVAVYKVFVPTLTNILLTPAGVDYADRATTGIKVADLAVTGIPTTGVTYTLDGSGDDNSLFQIVGTQLQIKSGTTLATQNYTVNVKVQENAQALNTYSKTITFQATVVLDNMPPTVSTITRQNPLAVSTNANSVVYRVTFSESVSGVDTSDFVLTKTGTATGSIASVSSTSGSVIDVTVNTLAGEGAIRLDLNNSGTGIIDTASNAIGGGYTGGQTYVVDRTAPTLTVGQVARTTQTNATVRFTSNEAGKYYYAVVASGAVQPIIDTSGIGINCGTTENTITLTSLNTGANDIYIVVKDTLENISVGTFKINIPAYVAPADSGGGNNGGGNSGGGNNGGGNSGGDNGKTESNASVAIRVNDSVVNAGTKVDTIVEDKTITTVSIDEKIINETITAEGKKAVITIPINDTSSDVLAAKLNGQIVKNMENKQAVIEIMTDSTRYTIPSSQINIDEISKQLGKNLELSDIQVTVEISKTSAGTNVRLEEAGNKDKFTIIAPPVDFDIRCTYNNETVEISRFNNYVARSVAIPTGTDITKITTGVVVDAGGSVRHVPTKLVVVGGVYYAKINSLTNSTYAVIWNPITYKDVKNSPARQAINDLGSRMVISGAKNGLFRPESTITRAEFVAMLVTSLGLVPGTKDTVYTDVKLTDWHSKYIEAANEYGIISGDAKTKFRPKDKITTQEAMTMLTNAMKITELKVTFKKGEAKKILASLAQAGQSQVWTDDSMAVCIKSGIVSVRSEQKISPKNKITRAEAAVMIRNLLVKSNLI